MMNRIILIGNGFDLAHGLPTSYADFIRGYNITLKLGLLVNMSDMMVYVLSIFLIRRIGKPWNSFAGCCKIIRFGLYEIWEK